MIRVANLDIVPRPICKSWRKTESLFVLDPQAKICWIEQVYPKTAISQKIVNGIHLDIFFSSLNEIISERMLRDVLENDMQDLFGAVCAGYSIKTNKKGVYGDLSPFAARAWEKIREKFNIMAGASRKEMTVEIAETVVISTQKFFFTSDYANYCSGYWNGFHGDEFFPRLPINPTQPFAKDILEKGMGYISRAIYCYNCSLSDLFYAVNKTKDNWLEAYIATSPPFYKIMPHLLWKRCAFYNDGTVVLGEPWVYKSDIDELYDRLVKK